MLELFEENWQELWGDFDLEGTVGAVFTKPEIVDLILDLAGYRHDVGRLAELRVLEPSCGDGAFLTRVVERLLASERSHQSTIRWDDAVFDDAVRAADISNRSLDNARSAIVKALEHAGCPPGRANDLAGRWTIRADFLLAPLDARYDLVVGNPPYVRIEELPKAVLARYRSVYQTATERADVYVAFIERGLQLLSPTGVLAYICANRFTKNKYGRSLRSLIAREYHVRYYVNLEHTQPFVSKVSAYPAIVVLDRDRGAPTKAVSLDDLSTQTLESVRLDSSYSSSEEDFGSLFQTWYQDGSPWLTTRSSEHEWLDELQDTHPLLEESAPDTRAGIGVATGCDSVYVLPRKHPEIEESRQLPLLMAGDIANAGIQWSGHYLVNPFSDENDGSLVPLSDFPGLREYLRLHEAQLIKRHVAKSRPHAWYRTIDRIWPHWVSIPKLVLPDIQGVTTVGLDAGTFYPHHNVYFIRSASWPLRALQAVLLSRFVRQQVRAFSVQMRGGSLRFQAQTLRRIRVPMLSALPERLQEALAAAALSGEQTHIDLVVEEAFATAPAAARPHRQIGSLPAVQRRVAENGASYIPRK